MSDNETEQPKPTTGVHRFWLEDEDGNIIEELGVLNEFKFSTAEMMMISAETRKYTNGSETINGPKQFFQGVGEQYWLAIMALVWLLRFQSGRSIPFAQCAITYSQLKAEDLPNPTKASSGIDETVTSPTSPEPSASPQPTSTL